MICTVIIEKAYVVDRMGLEEPTIGSESDTGKADDGRSSNGSRGLMEVVDEERRTGRM